MKKYILLYLICLISLKTGIAQFLENPSFEYEFKYDTTINEIDSSRYLPGWDTCHVFSTPDIGPSPNYRQRIFATPSDGISYIRLRTRGIIDTNEYPNGESYVPEDIYAPLTQPFYKDSCYSLSVDLLYDTINWVGYETVLYNCDSLLQNCDTVRTLQNTPSRLLIWGTKTACDSAPELLISTPVVKNNLWKTYSFIFTPKTDTINYIILTPYWDTDTIYPWNTDTMYHSTLMVDNIQISGKTTDMPKIKKDTTAWPKETMTLRPSISPYYSWEPRSGFSCLSCADQTITTSNSTQLFSVTVENSDGCPYTEIFIIRSYCDLLYPAPIEKLDTLIVPNDDVRLEATESDIYIWNDENGLNCENCQSSAIATISESKIYSVLLIDSLGCNFQEVFRINIRDCDALHPVNPTIKLDTTVLENSEILLEASPSQYYSWSPRNNLSSPNSRLTYAIITEPIEYDVLLLDDLQCFHVEKFIIDTIAIYIPPPPPANCADISTVNSFDIAAHSNSEITLSAMYGTNYSWTPSDGLSCFDCQAPKLIAQNATVYICNITDTLGCTHQQIFNIDIIINIPDVITPNFDGYNDYFELSGLENCSLHIFNRSGELIYSSDNYQNNWDGSNKQGEIIPGNYWYVIEDKSNDKRYKGNIFVKTK